MSVSQPRPNRNGPPPGLPPREPPLVGQPPAPRYQGPPLVGQPSAPRRNPPPVGQPPAPPRPTNPKAAAARSGRRRVALVGMLIVLLASLLGLAGYNALGQIQSAGKNFVLSQTATANAFNATPTFIPTPTPPPPVTVPALATKGTQIVNAATGQPVLLVGSARSSLEYECQGDGHLNVVDFLAMRSWGMNIVRIPLWTKFWLNIDNSCPTYRQTVAGAVANAEAAGLYVILTVQWNIACDRPAATFNGGGADYQYPMPDVKTDLPLWTALATEFKSDPHVIFDLYSEPHYINWQTWYFGGPIPASLDGGCAYQAIGMNTLAQKVRAIAPNLIVVSGADWGYDLSRVPYGYAIKASNVVYGTHPFAYGDKEPAYWPADFGNTAASYPVIATEFGSYDCQTSYVGQAIAFFKQYHMSWLAWSWSIVPATVKNPCNASLDQGPFLLADWSGAPTTPYGAYIRDQMLGIKP